jgi:hypothetical protein
MTCAHNPFCTILPPHILKRLAGDPNRRDDALRNLEITARMRGMREVLAVLPLLGPAGTKHRTIYDAKTTQNLPGTEVLDEGGKLRATKLSRKHMSIQETPMIFIPRYSTETRLTITASP